jgi:hypothetical protein
MRQHYSKSPHNRCDLCQRPLHYGRRCVDVCLNITCKQCRFRHPANRTCEEAKRLAEEARALRKAQEPEPVEYVRSDRSCPDGLCYYEIVIDFNLEHQIEPYTMKCVRCNTQVQGSYQELLQTHKEARAAHDRVWAQLTPICRKPTEGHSKGTCTKVKGHKDHCWFPNMWNDM